jgi:hypothetical protein
MKIFALLPASIFGFMDFETPNNALMEEAAHYLV